MTADVSLWLALAMRRTEALSLRPTNQSAIVLPSRLRTANIVDVAARLVPWPRAMVALEAAADVRIHQSEVMVRSAAFAHGARGSEGGGGHGGNRGGGDRGGDCGADDDGVAIVVEFNAPPPPRPRLASPFSPNIFEASPPVTYTEHVLVATQSWPQMQLHAPSRPLPFALPLHGHQPASGDPASGGPTCGGWQVRTCSYFELTLIDPLPIGGHLSIGVATAAGADTAGAGTSSTSAQ